jgi:hypothetical protein
VGCHGHHRRHQPHQAAEEGTQIIEYRAAKSGLPSWPAVRIEAIRQDVLAEQLERPTLPDLVSAPEAADILGVRPQRLHQLADERKDFPEPAYELRAGKLWLRCHRGICPAPARMAPQSSDRRRLRTVRSGALPRWLHELAVRRGRAWGYS